MDVLAKAAARWKHQRLGAAFKAWHARYKERKHLVTAASRVARRMMNRTLASAWTTWRSNANRKARVRRR